MLDRLRLQACNPLMPTELSVDLPLVDHHCHGRFAGRSRLREIPGDVPAKAISPSPPPARPEFQKPQVQLFGASAAAARSRGFVLPPRIMVARRRAPGAAEVNWRFLSSCGLGLPVDRYWASPARPSCRSRRWRKQPPGRHRRWCEIESVIEEVANWRQRRSGFGAGDRRSSGGSGKRCGIEDDRRLSQDPKTTRPRPSKADDRRRRSVGSRPPPPSGSGASRTPTIIRHGLWLGEICRQRKLPLQVHVGLATPDVWYVRLRPDAFHRFHRGDGKWAGADNAPPQLPLPARGGLAFREVFQNVYYDVGVILNYAAPMSADILARH